MDKSQLNVLFDPLLFARLVKVYNIDKFFILFYVIIFFLRMARNCLCDLFIIRNTFFFLPKCPLSQRIDAPGKFSNAPLVLDLLIYLFIYFFKVVKLCQTQKRSRTPKA